MILSCFLQTCVITQNKVTQTVNAGVLHQYSLSWVMLFGSVMAVKPLQRYLDGKKNIHKPPKRHNTLRPNNDRKTLLHFMRSWN